MSEAVAKARDCDAAGRHSDAISELVAGVNAQDAAATTELGKRLLIGDRAPNLPRDGARLIAEADALGSAEAAAILAVLYALGTNQAYGIGDAVDKLVCAAERGWQPVVELKGSIGQLLRRIECVATDLTWHQTEPGLIGAPSLLVRHQRVVS